VTAVIMMLVTTCRGLGAFTTGNDLYGMCTSSGEPFMDCIGYVRGVLDAGDYEGDAQGLIKELQQGIYSPGSTIGGWRWCEPKGMTLGQAVDVVTKYLRDNPQLRHHGGALLIVKAMHEAWPCPLPRH